MPNDSIKPNGLHKKKSKKKLLIIVGGIVVVAILVIVNLSMSSQKGSKVTSGLVERGDIISKVTATGRVKPKTEVKIQASVQATIVELPVKEGDFVHAGDLLVKLDQTRYQAAVRMVKADLASARANMKQSEANMLEAELTNTRAERMFEKGLLSDEERIARKTSYEVAAARYEASQYQVEQSQANVIQSQDALDKTVLTSPMNGVITDLNAEVGEIVLVGTMNNPGTVIMTVSDLSEIEVEAEVDETDIAAVVLGQTAAIRVDAFPDTIFEATVTEVGNSAKVSGFSSQDQVTNFIVKVQFSETYDPVKPGMTAEVDITTNEHKDVLHVPIQAVVMRDELPKTEDEMADEQTESSGAAIAAEPTEDIKNASRDSDKKEYEGVFLIRDGEVSFVEVTTGISDQQSIEITSGLSDSLELVIGPYKMLRKLKHGDEVIPEQKKEVE
ncbi:MAG: efflux RND transporter periplasmic adaptor subunit [Candidatus Zixiibacteriota bacterium]